MKKGTILGVIAGATAIGVVSALLYHKASKDAYGLDNDDFDDDDFEFDDSDLFDDDLDDEGSDDIDLSADDIVSYLESMSDEDLTKLGIVKRSAIDFEKLPISVLNKLYTESKSL